MRKSIALAATTAFALALAACGSSPDTDDAATEAEAVTAVDEGFAPVDGAAGEEVDGEPAETTEPTPAASASASATPTPVATPTQTPVAAMTPPAKFATCTVCHSTERGTNLVGPSLAGIVGRRAGSVAGANYSPAMRGANLTWTEANLRRYLVDPAAVVPGGTMPPPGLSAAEAQAIVNYMKTL